MHLCVLGEVRVVATEVARKFMQQGDVPEEALFGVSMRTVSLEFWERPKSLCEAEVIQRQYLRFSRGLSFQDEQEWRSWKKVRG